MLDISSSDVSYIYADIIESREQFEAIVNPVNCVGVMGAGLAKQFALRYPEILPAYRKACHEGVLQPGSVLMHLMPATGNPRFIVSFPTKHHWLHPSKSSWIIDGMESMYNALNKEKVESVGLPAIGCGLGGLPWGTVKKIIENAAAHHPHINTTVCLYATK